MDKEFKSERLILYIYIKDKGIEIHWTRPNSRSGNADIEKLWEII